MKMSGPRWPEVDEEYAVARDRLRRAEHELTRAIEAVSEQRRALPNGSVVDDYEFLEGPSDIDASDRSTVVRLSDLFGEHSTALLYNFMFDGSTREPCRMVTVQESPLRVS